MQVRFNCPTEACVALIEYEPLESAGNSITCPRCGRDHALRLTESIRKESIVDACAICGGRELFIRKDFPQRLGLAIVLLAGGASIYFFANNFVVAYAILAAAVVIDLLLYLLIGKVTVCYACRAEYRKACLNPRHAGFDLATSEKY
ncbi:MAG TPA: hypothetical protein VGM03_04590 [Phycisphaerae bacterium]|jgi:hypothetical protein